MELFIKIGFYLFQIILFIILLWYVKKRYPNANLPFLAGMFFYRIPFVFIYLNFLPGDWIIYYNTAVGGLNEIERLELGSDSIYYFTRPLVVLGLSVVEIFFAFSFVGFLGITFFYLIGHRLTNYTDQVKVWGINIFPWVLLYPSLHMFTVMLGKDPLVLFGIGMVGYSLIFSPFKKGYLLLGLTLILIVRPHLTFIIIFCLVISLLWSNEWGRVKKFMLFLIALCSAAVLIPIAISFFRVSEFSLEGIQLAIQFYEVRGDNSTTYVDMSSYPLPLKMFTYLFRPLFIDAPNPMLLVYSAENLFFLLITLTLFRVSFIQWIRQQPLILKFSMVHVIVGTMVLCNALSVFGLFMRQKTMVFLFLLLVIFAFIHHRNQKKTYRIKSVTHHA